MPETLELTYFETSEIKKKLYTPSKLKKTSLYLFFLEKDLLIFPFFLIVCLFNLYIQVNNTVSPYLTKFVIQNIANNIAFFAAVGILLIIISAFYYFLYCFFMAALIHIFYKRLAVGRVSLLHGLSQACDTFGVIIQGMIRSLLTRKTVTSSFLYTIMVLQRKNYEQALIEFSKLSKIELQELPYQRFHMGRLIIPFIVVSSCFSLVSLLSFNPFIIFTCMLGAISIFFMCCTFAGAAEELYQVYIYNYLKNK